jgi:DNA repair exonuclease SbcCD nuclease subunit
VLESNPRKKLEVSEGIDSEHFVDLKLCLEDLSKLNNEYIKFKLTNNKKRGKKKKFAEFIRMITTVSVEITEDEAQANPHFDFPKTTQNSAKKTRGIREESGVKESSNNYSEHQSEVEDPEKLSSSKVREGEEE